MARDLHRNKNSLGSLYEQLDLEQKSKDLVRWATELLYSLSIRSAPYSGGMKSPTRRCGPEGYLRSCYSLYGHNIPDSTGELSVLNKLTLGLRDIARPIDTLSWYHGPWPSEAPSKEEIRSEWIYHLAGALMHLTYGLGPKASRPDVPPILAHYFQDEGGFYWLGSSYDQENRIPARNSSKYKNYHAYSLKTLVAALELIAKRDYFQNRWLRLPTDVLLTFPRMNRNRERVGARRPQYLIYQVFMSSTEKGASALRSPRLRRTT